MNENRAVGIELIGGGFKNKGAELMLRTAILELEERIPGFQPYLHMNCGTLAERRSVGAKDVIWLHSHRIPGISGAHNLLAGLAARRPRTDRELLPRVRPAVPTKSLTDWLRTAPAARSVHSELPSALTAVLDISGFLYGDAWDSKTAKRRASYYASVRRSGGVVVLLPQQLGPFEKPQMKAAFQQVYANADLVFARDEKSFEAAAAVLDETNRLRVAPDFTTRKLEGRKQLPKVEGRACIVPNCQMVNRSAPEDRQAYPQFLRRCAGILRELGANPFFLLHDSSGRDGAIVAALEAEGCALDAYAEDDPWVVKEIIGRSLLTIGSRFHGLVSALSQGIPSLATGWSHKYPMLLQAYGVADCLVAPDEPEEELRKKIELLMDPGSRKRVIGKLLEAEGIRRQQANAMWDQVIELMRA